MKNNKFFREMVDSLVDFAQYDPELKEKLEWCDIQSREKGITFYDYIFYVLHKDDINIKPEQWFRSRN